ncbi:hypothetical protein D3C81_1676980 [compost metagenome]
MANSNDGFQLDTASLLGDLVQQLTAFGLQGRLVEVEERVSIEHDLCRHRGRLRLLLCNRDTVATGDTGGRGPESIAPAQFVRTVFPNVTERVAPVVHGLRGSYTRGRDGGEGERQSEFGGFVHVSPR